MSTSGVIPFHLLGIKDIQQVGGKNASLGEMISQLTAAGVLVPPGFATTSNMFRRFLAQDNTDARIYELLDSLKVEDVAALQHAGQQIRTWIMALPFPDDFEAEIAKAYQTLAQEDPDCAVAVRSSATAEDLPEASFAGQQETFLNIRGIDAVLKSVKTVYASLFNDRAISYRVYQKFDHRQVALSVGIQKMVRSDLAASGVVFTLDTESGFQDAVLITSAYGLGELIVQGEVNPDEFYVYKPGLAVNRPAILRRYLGEKQFKMIYQNTDNPGAIEKTVQKITVDPKEAAAFSLTEDEITHLAKQACLIEAHYGRPMDIEWAKDGVDNQIYILQARPETVESRQNKQAIERYNLKETGPVLIEGRSIGQRMGAGKVRILESVKDMAAFKPGEVLVADMTDPDWEPIMKQAAAIVTNRGGRTCHAAIIARELGIPAVVGCHHATKTLKTGQGVTVSCAEGDVGKIYEGILEFEIQKIALDNMPEIPTRIMMNLANPDRAFSFQKLPNAGVGLARLEFIISQTIGIHPQACLAYPNVPADVKQAIDEKCRGYASPKDFYIQKCVEGISTIAAAFVPNKVIVRLSDFKSNEYAHMIGGAEFEPQEENPMIGYRGASRYISEQFGPCFAMECEAIRTVRDKMGLMNVEIMIPFVRTLAEAKAVIDILEKNGLKRGENDLRIIMMCEVPANALLADEFLQYFDGFSIGSNDLTQLTLGLDRDSGLIAGDFDERNPAVKTLMALAIQACRKQNKYIGICGQGPSDFPDLAEWLVTQKIDSLSLNPDSILETWLALSRLAR